LFLHSDTISYALIQAEKYESEVCQQVSHINYIMNRWETEQA